MPSDFSELNRLAADLTDAPQELLKNVRKAVEVTARNIKDDWRQGAERRSLRGYAASIDYGLSYPGQAIEAEIGPNLAKSQGALGIVEDAPGDVQSAPQHAGRDALSANEADFERGLDIAQYDATVKVVEK